MLDPFWSVNPLEAISRSFSRLVFAPFGYVGEKIGQFVGGIIKGIPFWLQPLLVILLFGFVFLSLFGYRVVSPFLTIEPARRHYLEHRPNSPAEHAIKDRTRNEIMQKPDGKLMKSIRNASTDMDGFEDFLLGRTDDRGRPKTRFHAAVESITLLGVALWNILISWLNIFLVRQFPHHTGSREEEEEPTDEHHDVANVAQGQNNAGNSPPQVRRVIEENVLIPRRRFHVRLERSEAKSEEEKENVQPCSSSSSRLRPSKDSIENDTQQDCNNAPSPGVANNVDQNENAST